MQKLTIVEKNDKVSKYLSGLSTLKVKSYKWEKVNEKTFSEAGLLVCAEVCEVENAQKLKDFFGPEDRVLLAFDSRDMKSDVVSSIIEFCKKVPWIIGTMDLSHPPEFAFPQLRNLIYEQTSRSTLQRSSILEKNLDKILETVEEQQKKIKSLYEKLVPKRKQDIKGLSINGRYLVGSGPGGEFFEIIHKHNKVIFFLSSTSSYVDSSLILSSFASLQKLSELSFERLEDFITELSHNLDELRADKTDSTKLPKIFTFLIDLSTLEAEGLHFGQSQLFSLKTMLSDGNDYTLDPLMINQVKFKFHLERGEKYLLYSPGFRKNTKDQLGEQPAVKFAQGLFGEKSFDILDEIYFQLKKAHKEDFPPFDSSMVLFEVDKNVIIQV